MTKPHTKLNIKSAVITLIFALILLITVLYVRQNTIGSAGEALASKTGFYFDTVITLTIYGCADDNADELIDTCFEMAAEYENMLSATLSDSDISKINASGGKATTVSDETMEVIRDGIIYADESGGLFDITIGAVSGLWDFHTDTEEANEVTYALPPNEAVYEAVSHVDYTKIIIDDNNDTVMLLDPDMRLDLGGIAKGYIADRMKEYLVANGVDSAIINLGGNVNVIGRKPDGTDFTIGIQKPFGANSDISAKVHASDISVVTSGIYQRYFVDGDNLYHHIINPTTGYPENNDLASVTIISKSSVEADALSTAIFLMGYEEGYEYAEQRNGIDAIFIDRNGNVTLTSGVDADVM